MQIKTTATPLLDWTGGTLALGILEEATELTGDLQQLDEKLSGVISELIAEEEFKGKSGSTVTTRLSGNEAFRKLTLVGLGKAEDLNVDSYRSTAAAIARSAEKDKNLGISLPIEGDSAAITQAITEGIHLALHQDNRFKSDVENQTPKLETVEILGLSGQDTAISQGETIVSGVILARELVNAPANEVTPVTMAETAQKLADEYGLEIKILEQADCESFEQGMGAYLGVAKASDIPPKFIHLIYKPAGTAKRKVAIVGKSLTFDSGGLNLKTGGSGIETMKMDMGGGAATLGAAKAIAQIKPDVEVHFICAATENMISGKAMHPGDILKAANGKTIEVNNTDAEGRLTLADALVYAESLKVDAIVDLATLTGACIVALGNDIAGMWSTDESLAGELKTAAESAGEKFWQLPMEDKYFEGLKSKIADMKNTGPRAGGSITAALFLKQFIKETPWAHLDVAGPVWSDKPSGINNAGGTGFPVKTLVNWVLS
ncbi:putative cytosol aminopeptidase [Hyella patelloides LEGE 07179]|uniref:Probable cytosol aminopeptidase n=1 Tax=Hyella patelloides LEGE 07179 TaxID=945734 RepID=A0A563VTU6_9CYAN|nr:leucyl aminopeptidase [Hyella patelloides]VEP14799.1 putative cytosol aminopeptidase [Hyella patelloides LEGE 07179]